MKIKIDIVATREIPSHQAVAEAIIGELGGSWTVDESDYTQIDAAILTDLDEDVKTETIEFAVEVEVERETGKFMSKADVGQEIADEIDGLGPVDVDGVEYTIESVEVQS